jgi:hypothetical protein
MKYLISIILVTLALNSFSQDFAQYESIPMSTAAEFRRAEPQVALAADFVYNVPIDKTNLNRKNALSFIIKWMRGTSDYSFVVDESLKKITYNDQDLASVYFACLAKSALQKGKDADRDEIRTYSYILFATYCENPENNYVPKGEMRKLVDAKNKGQMKEYLETKKAK